MKDTRTMAHINMHAVLRNLEDLCRLDAPARELVGRNRTTVGLLVRQGPRMSLRFADGTCTASPGTKGSQVLLYFHSCEHFNAMVAGSANPLPLRGFTRLGFLTGPFTGLTKRLEHFLVPAPGVADDPAWRAVNAELSLYAAAHAMVQVANHDPYLQALAATMPSGVVAIEVRDGPALSLSRQDGGLQVSKARCPKPRARMEFASLDAAYQMLNGITDSFTCIASGQLAMSGFIPMIEVVDRLLFKVGEYLKPESPQGN